MPIDPLSPQSGPVYTGFLDDLDNEAHHVRERTRVQDTLRADRALAARLKLPVGAPVVRYRATRLRDDVPYGIATDIVPRPSPTASPPTCSRRVPPSSTR
ncbi:UTRA domain-containing protein [Streptomyces albulus]|nr:UTRA domain-containing protein [Streptomyces noursei]